jgi:GT2 family glycosyltransferase
MIDIIVPNYNGAKHLPTCLDALRRQTRRDFCVIVVDDGSTDESCALLARFYPEVQVIALPENRGLAAAVNAAFDATGGEYVVLLNNDTEVQPRWLEQLIGALDRYPEYAFAASKLLLFDRRDHLHSAGDYYRADGVPGNRGVWQRDDARYNIMEEVFGPCAGAAAYRRSALEALAEGGRVLDEDLVMYCEDVDLNLRARLRGFRTIYVPRAAVYHRLSATGGGALASYYCGRNFILVWVKNMPGALIWRFWPALLRAQIGYTLESLWHIREVSARARLRGQLAGLRALPHFVRKRQRRFSATAARKLAISLQQQIARLAPERREYTQN